MEIPANIKAKIEETVNKIRSDPDFAKEFQADPVKAIEKVTGTDLPDEMINPVIDGIKAKLTASDVMGKLGGLFGGKK